MRNGSSVPSSASQELVDRKSYCRFHRLPRMAQSGHVLGKRIRQYLESRADRRGTLHHDMYTVYLQHRDQKAILLRFRRYLRRKFRLLDSDLHRCSFR